MTMSAGHGGKTLLLVGSVPGERNVGQILLREILACLDPDQFVIAALLEPTDVYNDVGTSNVRVFKRPDEHAVRRFSGRIGGLKSAANRILVYERKISSLAFDVQAFAESQGVKRIWAVLNMTSTIDVCAKLMEKMKVPLLAHVWDDVGHLVRERGLDAFTRRRTLRRFARLVLLAERTAVIGESMASHYTTRFGARCQIIRHGVSDAAVARGRKGSDEEFVIGFSGGMYSPSAWRTLQKALSGVGWCVGTRRVRLVVMSGHVGFRSTGPANVEYLGWRSDADVHARLSKCDLLYLPQPFEPQQRELAELSFPTKFSTYVSTGRPVLVHAPEYASLPVFLHSHPDVPVCKSLIPSVLAELIEQLSCDEHRYRCAAQASALIANKELSRNNFEVQVRSFLGASAA